MSADPSPTLLALQEALAGRYALERELGRGGMGVVYLARDISLDRPVAIKVLPPVLASIPELRERFLREARTAARLSHPHIVPIHAVEEQGDLLYFVMGYVEGETLSQRIERQGPLPPEEAARILQEVAWALAYAHRHGVIHRDVKPDNILIERGTGRALVTDFGIAQVTEAGSGSGAGSIVGTVRYMSPEQIGGRPLDGRSDLFSLGATAFRVLTGRPPFEGTVNALNLLARGEPLPPVRSLRAGLPGRLAAIVDRCLELDPGDRFPDGEALAEALAITRGQQRAVPPPVERFGDLYKTLAAEIAGYAAVLVVLAAELLLVRDFGLPAAILAVILTWSFFGAIGLGILRFVQLVRAARRLLEQGYTLADVRSALDRPAPPAPGRKRSRGWRRAAMLAGGLLGAALWAIGFRWQIGFSLGPVLDGLIMALFTLAPVVALRGLFARLLRPGSRGWYSHFWWKTMDWKVFKVAGLGRARTVPAAEPTEIALGAGARELFDALPSELQARFSEVPEVLNRIEAQASRLRSAASPDAEAQVGSTLAALEQVRLDLLRLRAGSGNEGDLTGDLDAARGVTESIERFLSARRELDTSTPS